MRIYLFILISFLLSSSVFAETKVLAIAPFFVGEWTAISNTCLPGSEMIIRANSFKRDDETKMFRVDQSAESYQLVEITSKLNCQASCESKYYKFVRTSDTEIRMQMGQHIRANDLDGIESECSYSKGWKAQPKAKLKHDQGDSILVCDTGTHLIRIENAGEKVRYSSWKIGKPMSSKPELTLLGNAEYEGSAHNATFTFKSGANSYVVDQDQVCSDEQFDKSTQRCRSSLMVYKGTDVVSSKPCHP
jgi:hypothetical protein